MKVVSKARVYKRIEIKAARFQICGDADKDFVHLGIPGMQFSDEKGYFYDNWTCYELMDLAEGIQEFLKLYREGNELVKQVEGEAAK